MIHITKKSRISKKLIQRIKKNSMLPEIRLQSIYTLAKYCELKHIEGDFCECGSWKGGAAGLMALTNIRYGVKRRNLHVFDIFDDICAPDINKDGDRAIGDALKLSDVKTESELKNYPKKRPLRGFYRNVGGKGTLSDNKKLFSDIKYNRKHVHFYKGWFEDTMSKAVNKIHQIAFLHIDGDWYSSVKTSLDYLYPKVSLGGIVAIDDYGYYEGCTKAVDEFVKNHVRTICQQRVYPWTYVIVKRL